MSVRCSGLRHAAVSQKSRTFEVDNFFISSNVFELLHMSLSAVRLLAEQMNQHCSVYGT